MIPRFQPPFGSSELFALLGPSKSSPSDFESAFARRFGGQAGVSFAYGRSAQRGFLEALDISGSEVVTPAYTCSVVAHAVSLSGNRTVFVDVSLDDYNPEPERIAAAITPATRAVIATNTFGYPQDPTVLRQMVDDAGNRYGHKIWLVQDCAHSFGAEFEGQMVSATGDVALFGLNVSKIISSIFGGMLTFGDVALADRVRSWRDRNTVPSDWRRELTHRAYAMAAASALSSVGVTLTDLLLRRTKLLDRWATSYHLDDRIEFPPDHDRGLSKVGASVGMLQLDRYDDIIARRRRNAEAYAKHLTVEPGSQKAPLVPGATYSHYVVRVEDRDATLAHWRRKGVQLGELIQYSIPHLTSYFGPAVDGFDNSLHASQHLVNFPVDAAPDVVDRIVAMSAEK